MGIATYALRRILLSIPIVILISIICFSIIALSPGDYADAYAALVATTGGGWASQEVLDMIRMRYGLDQPVHIQYWRWISGFPRGDFGIAMSISGATVASLLRERLPQTLVLNFLALLFAEAIALPTGVYSATHKYKVPDYILTFLAFLGVSVPGFIIGVLIIAISVFWFGGGYLGSLFSTEFIGVPWSWARVGDFIRRLPIPVLAIGIAQVSNTTRIMRGNMLDVLNQPFIVTARAKGLNELAVNWKHGARIALNPIISRVGVYLPEILAIEMLVSIVLNLQTIGPLFYQALISHDMYLAATILLVISVILVLGNLLADIALSWIDPRIRYD